MGLSNFQYITGLCAAARQCSSRQFENVPGPERKSGNSKGLQPMIDPNNRSTGIQVSNVDRESHSQGVDSIGGLNPQPFSRIETLRLAAQQALHAPVHRARKLDIRSQACASCPVKDQVPHRHGSRAYAFFRPRKRTIKISRTTTNKIIAAILAESIETLLG